MVDVVVREYVQYCCGHRIRSGGDRHRGIVEDVVGKFEA